MNNNLNTILKGDCTCSAGYTGINCENKCDDNYFGINCNQECDCDKDNSIKCDAVTGKCICKPEWGGNYLSNFSLCYLCLIIQFNI